MQKKTKTQLFYFTLILFLMIPLPAFSGKTISIIQKPLINIPAIALPGDSIVIEYDLPESESLVYVNLFYRGRETEPGFRALETSGELGYRQMLVYLPEKMLYGLYDIQVYGSAPSSIDISENSLYVIPDYKEEYTFIHISDTHLPSHKFWGDDGVESDLSEMEDLREVIEDINLINPEFVLHTGDLINDGELEALGIPAISLARDILESFEVPVFMVPGNHDLGGWDETPASDGTARRYWWNYFGWQALDNTNLESVNTQDYVFHYGSDLYIGMESYVNYDRWRENIYGYRGFTNIQLQWLNNTLEKYPNDEMKVLFYHYDFENDLHLQDLGVDAAFWGHIHYNSGSTSSYPLNLSTGAVCDGRRWYRIVKVRDHNISDTWSIQAGDSGETVTQLYNQDSSSVVLHNASSMSFDNCMVKFPLKEGKKLLSLENAVLYQIDSLSIPAMIYALTELPSNSTVNVSMLTEDISSSKAESDIPASSELRIYPNPFNPSLQIDLFLTEKSKVKTEILDIRGQSVFVIHEKELSRGKQGFFWDASEFPSGIYFVRSRISAPGENLFLMKKCLLLK